MSKISKSQKQKQNQIPNQQQHINQLQEPQQIIKTYKQIIERFTAKLKQEQQI